MIEKEPEEIRQVADDILRKSEYLEPEEGLAGRLLGWILDRLDGLFGDATPGAPGGFPIGWVLLGLIAVVTIWMLYRVMPRHAISKTREDVTVDTEVRARSSRADWLDLARAAERDGRFRDAVHARYRAIVAGLLDRDELPQDDGATSGEYTQAFDVGPPRGTSFQAATGRFEDVWYGGAEANKGDVLELEVLDDDVMGPVAR